MPEETAAKARMRIVNRNSLIAGFFSAVFFFAFTNPSLCLDQDQGSKVAKIESLARDQWFASPMRGPQYYREAYFGVYYQIEAFVRKLLPLRAITVANYSSAFLGVVFVLAISIFLRSLTGIGPWWVLFLILNTPALAINFLYANEAAFSITFVAIAAALISLQRGVLSDVVSGCIFGLSLFCRPDVIFLAPFLAVLLCTDTSDYGLKLKFDLRRLIIVGGGTLLTALCYWLVFIRSVPSQTAFPWIIDAKLIASYFIFGFGPIVVLLALVGAARRVTSSGWSQLLLPLSTLVPFVFYYRDLGSTKYILGFAFGTLLCAAWAISSFPRFALASIPLAAILWFLSITPFGVFGVARGAHWVIPVGHGPISFGSYSGFYGLVRDGFFQNRYSALKDAWAEVLPTLLTSSQRIRIVGQSDVHMLVLLCEEKGFSGYQHPVTMDYTGEMVRLPGRQVMLFNSYTRLSYLTANGAEDLVRSWLSKGMVKPLVESAAVPGLPLAVEIGPGVTDGSPELGRRILYSGQKAYESGLAPLTYFEPDYNAFCWVAPSSHPAHILYQDSSSVATTDCSKASLIWGNWWPAVYYQQYANRAKEALAPK